MHRLTDELLPALIAKLGATGLGELEVSEGAWRVRLRRERGAQAPSGRDKRRGGDRERSTGGDRERGDAGSDRPGHHQVQSSSTRTDTRTVATSPAVGIYRPRAELAAGTRVRAGDRIGAVDMLGVAQEVVAPADGIVGASLAQGGDAVEYGQELIVIEFAGATSPSTASTSGPGSA
ncbi:MAG: hypothetical protein ABIP77_01315 [Candidatus Limnocylindrales bacterium]